MDIFDAAILIFAVIIPAIVAFFAFYAAASLGNEKVIREKPPYDTFQNDKRLDDRADEWIAGRQLGDPPQVKSNYYIVDTILENNKRHVSSECLEFNKMRMYEHIEKMKASYDPYKYWKRKIEVWISLNPDPHWEHRPFRSQHLKESIRNDKGRLSPEAKQELISIIEAHEKRARKAK